MKKAFLETMTAKEFCECLQDHGLYSMAVDTMVSTLERQGRNVNEALTLEVPDEAPKTTRTVRLKEDQKVKGRIEYIVREKRAGSPYGVIRTLEGEPTHGQLTPDVVKAETSEKLIASLNDPHDGKQGIGIDIDACWDAPHTEANPNVVKEEHSQELRNELNRVGMEVGKAMAEDMSINPAPLPEGGIDQIIAESNENAKAEKAYKRPTYEEYRKSLGAQVPGRDYG